ncbi:hypothetical protein Atai01_78680 [Amycolatopsis taiwanensis]|uniref:Uncharacterized protein n=2 Tax=Amycolatopsis taiwanensis TaxID=342230 RepID=A0A9W6R900_9PSEU|nr:hypothetical protein Atai01_78680 [Amycolatopsis taiwanensis]
MCWGTQHGWKDAVKLAKQPDPTGRDQLRSDVDDAWRSAFVGKRNANQRTSSKISYPKKIAGIDSGLADLIDWLARDYAAGKHSVSQRTTRHPGQETTHTPPDGGSNLAPQGHRPSPEEAIVVRVEKLGSVLAEEVLKDIERAYQRPVPQTVKVALADHFWCDLLAQLAHVIDDGIKLFDKVPDRAAELIMKSRAKDGRIPVEKMVVRIAVKSVWGHIQNLTPFGWVAQVRRFVLVVRILAVLICKAPERHQAVVTYCLDPLGDQLTSETKKRLVKVLREWLPRTVSELA